MGLADMPPTSDFHALGAELRYALQEAMDRGFQDLQHRISEELRGGGRVSVGATRSLSELDWRRGASAVTLWEDPDEDKDEHEWTHRHMRGYQASVEASLLEEEHKVRVQTMAYQRKRRPSTASRISLQARFNRRQGSRFSVHKPNKMDPVVPPKDEPEQLPGEPPTADNHGHFTAVTPGTAISCHTLPSSLVSSVVRDEGGHGLAMKSRSDDDALPRYSKMPGHLSDEDSVEVLCEDAGNVVSEKQTQQEASLHEPPSPRSATSRSLSERGPRARKVASLPEVENPSLIYSIAAQIVTWRAFDPSICTLIVLNAISIGYQAEYAAANLTMETPRWSQAFESACGLIFLLELSLRLLVYKSSFFTMRGFRWNIFDLIVVTIQVFEQIGDFFVEDVMAEGQLGFVRVLRVLRLVRIARLVRILRLISELRTLVIGILGSMKTLGWTVLLLFMLIYPTSLYLTQLVSDYRIEKLDDPDIDLGSLVRFYGSVGSTMLSMFQAITGGLDWDIVLRPLANHVSPWAAVVLCSYVAFSLLAMMNVVTGIFVDSVLRSAKTDKDSFLVSNARELFVGLDGGFRCQMTWDVFKDALPSPQMKEFFKAIDVDPSEARGLFNLLDLDHSGSITADEFLNGCLRLRGPAKALDLAVLIQEVRDMSRRMRHANRPPHPGPLSHGAVVHQGPSAKTFPH